MQIYHYHPTTLEYIGPGTADPSPLEPGVWLVPGYATTVAPPAPIGGKIRRFTGGAWEQVTPTAPPVDPEYTPSILEVRDAKLHAINEGKNMALDGGFVHNGVMFDSDTKARLAYIELSLKFGQDAAYMTPWKASSGAWVTMDAALFMALQPAYEAHIQACFQWQAAREMEVAAAGALGDIEAIRAVSEVM